MLQDESEMIKKLLNWYDTNARVLPWRSKPEPYFVWVSEIMLQQTRVEAVKEYFRRFIGELPTIYDLAQAKEEKLLKLWEGLGYYNRVRNLQKGAVKAVQEYKGKLPADYEKLLEFPGIGPYTAGAIASIAYQLPVPAVDGNVLRVYMRICGCYDDITKASVKKRVESDLRRVIPACRPGDFNQALMELGAVVCIPNGKPLCLKCPVCDYCKGLKKGNMMELPVKPQKRKRRIEEKTVLVLERQNRYALHKRPEKGLLARLWELPNLEGRFSISKLEDFLNRQGVTDYNLELLGEAVHVFSHVEWHMLGYKVILTQNLSQLDGVPECHYEQGKKRYNQEEDRLVWVNLDQMNQEYALPSAFSAFQKALV